jgi:NAD(P)H-dependent flavin oxidoreductase YrpB (nitropropane dioxygenase family)
MDRIDHVYACARQYPDVPFGIMLRDPQHRVHRVAALYAYALAIGMTPEVRLITNGIFLQNALFAHLPWSQFAAVPEWGTDSLRQASFGVSAHSRDEAERAAELGAAYVTLSPIFPSDSKPDHPGLGLDALAEAARDLPIPIFALGGMKDLASVEAALDAGAYGVASISLFAPGAAEELERVTHYLKTR